MILTKKNLTLLIKKPFIIFKINNFKVGIPIIQSILYYFALIFLYKKLRHIFSNRMCIFIIVFLALEPTIFQWHSTFWSESLYLFFLVIFLNIFWVFSALRAEVD